MSLESTRYPSKSARVRATKTLNADVAISLARTDSSYAFCSVPVSSMDEVLKHALTRQPDPIEWTEEDEERARKSMPVKGEDSDSAVTAH